MSFKLKYGFLASGFGLIIILMVIFGITSLQKSETLADLTEKLYRHPLTVSNAVLEANADIIAMHRHMKDVVLARNDEDLGLAISKVDESERRVYEHFEIVMERFLGDKSRIVETRLAFANWKPIRSEVIKLTRQGRYDEAAAITKGKGARYVVLLTGQMDGLIVFAHNKAAEFLKNSKNEQKESQTFLYTMLAVIVFLSSIIAVLVWFSFLRFERQRSRADEQLREAHNGLEMKVDERTKELMSEIEERKKAEVDAEKANAAKSEFLASMSHDLRTPLNAIMGFSDMMRQKAFGPLGHSRYETYAEDIHNSGSILVSLINDVLDLSKIEAGKYQLADEPVCVSSIVDVSRRQLLTFAGVSNITLTRDVPADTPPLLGDERALVQVLNNLLSNAIKFTPEGGMVHVSVFLNKQNGINIAIKDTGIGMSEEGIEKALRPFEQADGMHSRRHQGTGLGLHLCVNFMKLFGGTLVIDSEEEKGTAVTLGFPPERTLAQS